MKRQRQSDHLCYERLKQPSMLKTNLAYKQIVSYSRHTVNPQWSDLIALQVIFHLTKLLRFRVLPLNFQWHYTRTKKTWCINKVHYVKRKSRFLNLNRESISRLYLTPWRWQDKITNEFAECAMRIAHPSIFGALYPCLVIAVKKMHIYCKPITNKTF